MAAMGSSRVAVVVFGAQAVLGGAWWVGLALSPDFATWFSLPSDEAPTIYRFALPDLVVFVIGSMVTASLFARASRWAAPAAWCVTGGVAYATLWCVGAALWHGLHPAGAALMLPVTLVDLALAARWTGDAR